MTALVTRTPRLRSSELRGIALASLMTRDGLTYTVLGHAPTCSQPWTDRQTCPECQAVEAAVEFTEGHYRVAVRWAGGDGDWFALPAKASDLRAAVLLGIETARACGLRPWKPAPQPAPEPRGEVVPREELIERTKQLLASMGSRPDFGGRS